MSNIVKYFKTGFKVWLVAVLGGLIMIVPYLLVIAGAVFDKTIGLVMYVLTILTGFTVSGWLFDKYKGWIFKR